MITQEMLERVAKAIANRLAITPGLTDEQEDITPAIGGHGAGHRFANFPVNVVSSTEDRAEIVWVTITDRMIIP